MGDLTIARAMTLLDSELAGTYIGLLKTITDADAGTVTEYTTGDYPGYARPQPSWAVAANQTTYASKQPSADVVAAVPTSNVTGDCVGIGIYSAVTAGTLSFVKAFPEITVASCTTTNGSAVVTTTGSFTTSGVVAGQKVTGTGIPANTYVLTKDSATQITLSSNATAAGTVTLTFPGPIRILAYKLPRFSATSLVVALS